jgi:hypothetical protein
MVCLALIARARRAENTREWGFSCKLFHRIPRGIGAHIELGPKRITVQLTVKSFQSGMG